MAIKTLKKGINFVYVTRGVIIVFGLLFILSLMLLLGLKSSFLKNGSQQKVSVDQNGKITFKPVARGQDSSFKERVFYTINTQDEWAKLWDSMHPGRGPEGLPTVNFDEEMIIIAMQGSQPTGGYMVRITGVEHKDAVVGVTIKEDSPGVGCLTTQALTAPFDIVRIPKIDAKFVYDIKYEKTECK
ncbi:MAG: protease complex subunit PrcB family protein [bacterium]|nr:protease complex subunit PrcB family protein [bacterium]